MNLKEKKSIGISISDRSVEILELSFKGDVFNLSALARQEFSSGIVEFGRIVDYKTLKNIFFETLNLASINLKSDLIFNFALPEAQTYVHIFRDNLKNKKEENFVFNELISTIPIEKKYLLFRYQKNKINPNFFEFLTFSIDKRVFLEWNNFFRNVGIKIDNFSFEPLALAYGLFLELPKSPFVLLDMGSRTSSLSIFLNQKLKYSYGIRVGGEYLTKKIAEGLKIDISKADELKFNYGLNHPDNILYNSIVQKTLEHLKIETERNIKYFKKNYLNKDEKFDLYLLGGSAQLLGIKDYFKKINYFKNIEIGSPSIDLGEKIEFIESLGLALLSFHIKNRDLIITNKKKEKIKFNFNIKKIFSKSLKIKIFLKYFLIALLGFSILFFSFYLFHGQKEKKIETQIKNNSLNNLKVPDLKSELKKEEIKIDKVRIKNIGTSLNIREGAGTNFKVVGKANPGEEYKLLSEEGDWQKIELENKLWGWVFNKYTDKFQDIE